MPGNHDLWDPGQGEKIHEDCSRPAGAWFVWPGEFWSHPREHEDPDTIILGKMQGERPELLLHRHHPPDQGFAWWWEWQPEILDLCLVWTTGYPCWMEMEEVLHPSGEADSGLPPVPLTGQESPAGQGLQNNFLSLFSVSETKQGLQLPEWGGSKEP